MVVLIFGSRTWNEDGMVEAYLGGLRPGTTVISGGAPGADTMAEAYANRFDLPCRVFPAHWDEFGRAAGPKRNQQMVDDGRPDRAIGFVDKPLEQSKGSADMARRCQKAGIPVFIVTKLPPLA